MSDAHDRIGLVVDLDARVLGSDRRRVGLQLQVDDELLAGARQQQLASLAQVRYAILESNGAISYISYEN